MKDLEKYQAQDLDDLEALFRSEDVRSLAEMIAADPVVEYTVEKAERSDAGWEVHFDDGLVGLFTTEKPIKAGDTLGLYTGGKGAFGSMRHGFSINGEVIEWKTPFERYADRIAMLASHDRKDRERAEQSRTDVEEWLAQLHGPYKARIERFRQRPDFDMKGGTYETYPVLMAQRIEGWVRDQNTDLDGPVTWDVAVKLVKDLEQMPYDEQAAVLHARQADKYGVSGHQVDSAFGMAAAVLSGREI